METLLPNEYVVSLITLNQGAAVELFNDELKKVLDNIADPNCEAETGREIVLKVKLLPDENRRRSEVKISVESKLAPHKPSATSVYFGRVDGQRVAVESNPDQGNLFDKDKGNLKTFVAGETK